MPTETMETMPGKPPETMPATSPTEKEQAVRLVRQLRAEIGTEQGTIPAAANQLGYGVESVRAWVKQADVDNGQKPGMTTEEAKRIKELEQQNRELKCATVRCTVAIPLVEPRLFLRRHSTAHRGSRVFHRRQP